LRKDLFRKLKANYLLVSQKCLDEFAFIKNHYSTVGKTGQTPAEMARLGITQCSAPVENGQTPF
jgi:hypothetical protein